MDRESSDIVKEFGFANLSFGLIAIVSLIIREWGVVSAFGSGLYFGMPGSQPWLKTPVGVNEAFALVTDIIICIFLLIYFVIMLKYW